MNHSRIRIFECNSIKTNIELTKQLLVRLLMNNVNKLNLKIHQKAIVLTKEENIIIDEITDSNDQLIGAEQYGLNLFPESKQ